ncbi:diguanylate cyclase [Roseibium aquae]|uniref:Diguanylate cyclase n=1 Tax=Roseibium aquae TaxID=1323746 RepID=A0A916TAE0_9HYPH|nr:bifunctional diguanylate cyclase/phosphodiesterase [Roseibium aquae]GGB37862.1 diguanylate cyclase [Roseibium aquae]
MTAQPLAESHISGFPDGKSFLERSEGLLDYAFQPIVDADSGDTYGFEALLRNVGQMGFETPADIFDFAAKTGCLRQFELLLRKKAIVKYAALRDRGNTKLFLNVDTRLLSVDGYLLDETLRLLTVRGLKSSQIVLENSEADNVRDSEKLKHFARASRKLGFGLAMDDYGRGYSQLQSLYELEPDILKIDQFFIRDIQNNARKRHLVKTVVDMAHILGMRVVAEGVETLQEFSICREVGCDLIQGFLISPGVMDTQDLHTHYKLEIPAPKNPDLVSMTDREMVAKEVKQLVPLRDNARMQEVLTFLGAGRVNAFIPVVNASGEPRGIIREKDIKTFVYMPFGRDLLLNPVMSGSIGRFIHRCPIAGIGTPLDQLVGMIADEEDEAGGIIITNKGRYYGFLTTTALLKISNEARIRAAENQNPLTKLPGNASIIQYVQLHASTPDFERCFCYLDLDNFKPFNDVYGFATGDRALLLFSEIVKRFSARDDLFAGHIGGDDFFIGARGRTLKGTRELILELQEQFRHQAESLYDSNDRLNGYIQAQDRFGVERIFPLLRCSAAILHLPAGMSVDRKDIIGRQIAILKSEAKNAAIGIAEATFGQMANSKAN